MICGPLLVQKMARECEAPQFLQRGFDVRRFRARRRLRVAPVDLREIFVMQEVLMPKLQRARQSEREIRDDRPEFIGPRRSRDEVVRALVDEHRERVRADRTNDVRGDVRERP